MSKPPLHLAARDFDAYAPEKATSNAYSRPRLEVKQRAMAWARGVVARLAELGIPVAVHGSDEHPTLRNRKRVDCQWVFFWRDEPFEHAARAALDRLLEQGRSIAAEIDDPSPYTRRAFLALRIDASAVEVCFAVHPEARVDVDNLRARLAEGEEPLAAELMAALAALPDEFAVGVSPDDRIAAGAATPGAIRSLIERAAAGQVPLWIGWSVTRETAALHSAILDEQLEDALVALAPIYRLVAWSRENDHIALDRRLRSAEEERARTHAEAEAQTSKWHAEQAEARRRASEEARARAEEQRAAAPAGLRRPSLDTLFSSQPQAKPRPAPRPRPEAPRAEAPRPARAVEEARPAPSATQAAQAAPRPLRPVEPPAMASPQPAQPPQPRAAPEPVGLEKGARVRVLAGAFADKVGVIGELDGRGGARVLLGLLSTRLDLADLEPVIEGRGERPALQSSHRRPAPAPRKSR